jgi:hypothetical protein
MVSLKPHKAANCRNFRTLFAIFFVAQPHFLPFPLRRLKLNDRQVSAICLKTMRLFTGALWKINQRQ